MTQGHSPSAGGECPRVSPAPLILLRKAIALLGDTKERQQRRLQQDYTTLAAYFTDEHWKSLLSSTTPLCAKEDLVFSVARELGMWLPSEPSSKMITSLLLVMSEKDPMALPCETKAAYHRGVKKAWDQKKGLVGGCLNPA